MLSSSADSDLASHSSLIYAGSFRQGHSPGRKRQFDLAWIGLARSTDVRRSGIMRDEHAQVQCRFAAGDVSFPVGGEGTVGTRHLGSDIVHNHLEGEIALNRFFIPEVRVAVRTGDHQLLIYQVEELRLGTDPLVRHQLLAVGADQALLVRRRHDGGRRRQEHEGRLVGLPWREWRRAKFQGAEPGAFVATAARASESTARVPRSSQRVWIGAVGYEFAVDQQHQPSAVAIDRGRMPRRRAKFARKREFEQFLSLTEDASPTPNIGRDFDPVAQTFGVSVAWTRQPEA